NEQVKTSNLEELIGVERPSRIAFWKEDSATINELYVPKLIDIFKLYYKKEGFYEANITQHLEDKSIHFVINENRHIKIENISIESDIDISEVITLVKGSRFRATTFGEIKANIKKMLLKEGLCRYELDTKAYIDLEKYSANIEIKLKKGELCHFGKVTVGSDKSSIEDDVVLSRLHFKEGEKFDINKIKESYESLYSLEAFDTLHMVYDTKYYSVIPVDIRFKEIKHTTHSRIGIGYATDLRFQAKYHWEYKNFYGGGRKLLFDILYSDKQKRIENNFFNPALYTLFGYHLDFQNSAGYTEERNIHDFDEKVAYNKVYLQHREDKWFHSIGLGIENIEISNDKNFFLIYPFMQVIYDLRDSKVNPKKGIYFSHEMEYGLPYSPDSTTYLKYIEELRLIYTLWDVTLSAVGRIGAIEVYNNRLPESKKFFAGGAFSNRAYGYERIGITESSTAPSSDGGMSMANLNLEANFPFYNSLHLGVFSDNTMISSNERIWEFADSIIHSAGFGLRYMTPVGPFKLDFGFNLNKYNENAIHFQIGQSF
ncbi:MAG: BamA/TamA family outer membrane protein, partial [Epsilonproteobacteria bacterium]|nr:BamA/TamA family outer membrane protein [Campylobacterota bacterium]